jgi:hypothetical protein
MPGATHGASKQTPIKKATQHAAQMKTYQEEHGTLAECELLHVHLDVLNNLDVSLLHVLANVLTPALQRTLESGPLRRTLCALADLVRGV